MTGFSARVVLVLALLLASRALTVAQRPLFFDPERFFMFSDADPDGCPSGTGISRHFRR
jgi:hypothetical protein